MRAGITGSRRRLRPLGCAFGIALLVAAASAPQAGAEEIVAVYAAYWAGLPAAEIRLRLRDGDALYHDEIEIRTEGLPHLVTRFRGTALAEGRLSPDRPAAPSHYDAFYDLRKRRDSRISMRFVARGEAIIAERGSDDTSRKPPLAEAFRRDAVDPITALERIRAALRSETRTQDDTFAIPVYDGARRFDILGHIPAQKDRTDGVLRVELTLRPIAGFKGESSDDGDPDDAPRPVELMVTDDVRLLPLSITVRVFFMPLVVQLHRICPASEACS